MDKSIWSTLEGRGYMQYNVRDYFSVEQYRWQPYKSTVWRISQLECNLMFCWMQYHNSCSTTFMGIYYRSVIGCYNMIEI